MKKLLNKFLKKDNIKTHTPSVQNFEREELYDSICRNVYYKLAEEGSGVSKTQNLRELICRASKHTGYPSCKKFLETGKAGMLQPVLDLLKSPDDLETYYLDYLSGGDGDELLCRIDFDIDEKLSKGKYKLVSRMSPIPRILIQAIHTHPETEIIPPLKFERVIKLGVSANTDPSK